jgi:hypothetical protein
MKNNKLRNNADRANGLLNEPTKGKQIKKQKTTSDAARTQTMFSKKCKNHKKDAKNTI